VVLEERLPAGDLVRVGRALRQMPRDGGFADADAEFQELGMDAWRPPTREMWNSTFPGLCEANGYVEPAGSDRLDAMR